MDYFPHNQTDTCILIFCDSPTQKFRQTSGSMNSYFEPNEGGPTIANNVEGTIITGLLV